MLYLTQMFKSSTAHWKQAHTLTVVSMNFQGKRKSRNEANVNQGAVINNGGWRRRAAALTPQTKTNSQAKIGNCKDCSPATVLRISANNFWLFLKWCTAPGLVWSGLVRSAVGVVRLRIHMLCKRTQGESLLEGLRVEPVTASSTV